MMGDTPLQEQTRRQFLKNLSVVAVVLPTVVLEETHSCSRAAQRASAARGVVGGPCDGCEGIYEGMPSQLSWETTIAADSEPGERLEISGLLLRPDGKTPAPDVILYVYHTDARGYYSPAPDATGLTRRHGHLRGWMKTNALGQYTFRTIKPTPYPNRNIPAHIHPIVKEPDKHEYYIDEYRFDDDPLLTAEERSRAENRGGSGIIHLAKSSTGLLVGRRDIVLGRNIPNYS